MSYCANTVASTLTTTPEGLETIIEALRNEVTSRTTNSNPTRDAIIEKSNLDYWTGSDGKTHISFYYPDYFWFDDICDIIAPYVEGMIGFEGEDGCLFGYRYEDGNLIYTTGKIVWEDK